MSIRIRTVSGEVIAICAARSIEKLDDIYLDDYQHHLLSAYYSNQFFLETEMLFGDIDRSLINEAKTKILPMLSRAAKTALDNKFISDFNDMYDILKFVPHGRFKLLDYQPKLLSLMQQEESDNHNRTNWDKTYGDQKTGLDKILDKYGDR